MWFKIRSAIGKLSGATASAPKLDTVSALFFWTGIWSDRVRQVVRLVDRKVQGHKVT